jgi:hypothetical protein
MTTHNHHSSTDLTTRKATAGGGDLTRVSACFGVGFAVCQLVVMVFEAILVLPHGGSPTDPAVERGESVLDAERVYRLGNYAFCVVGVLLLGFLGAVSARLRRADASGTLATVAVASGAVLGVIWPYSAVLHDVALDAAQNGSDVRLLAAWDAIPPYSLAFSVMPRLFLVGAVVIGLRRTGSSPWLQRTGVVVLALSAVGSATLVNGALFPLLALSSLGFELWIGALAWTWLRGSATTRGGATTAVRDHRTNPLVSE